MPIKDSQWTYIHMTSPHHVLYREKWIKDELPFDDIDFNAILLQQQQKLQFQNVNFLKNAILVDEDEEDELNVPLNQTQFGVSRNRRKLFTNNVWKDLDLQTFLDLNADTETTKDKTILKPIDNTLYQSRADFIDSSIGGESLSLSNLEESPNSELLEFPVPEEDEGINNPSTTPLMTRAKKREFYQTPVGRILR